MNQVFKLLQDMLARQARLHPGIWETIDRIRGVISEQKDIEFDPRVFLPDEGYQALFKTSPFAPASATAQALAAWRPSQDIVEIDEEVLKALVDTPVGAVPTEILKRLPAWCVFIALPPNEAWKFEAGRHVAGVFAYYAQAVVAGALELRFVPIVDDPDMDYQVFPFDLSQTTVREGITAPVRLALGEKKAVEYLAEEKTKRMQEEIEKFMGSMVSILLYVITQWDAAHAGPTVGATAPGLPSPKKTRKGWRLFPPNKPCVWHLGGEAGEQIRLGRGQASGHALPGGTKAPHVRRAHWHSFWSGTLVVKDGVEPKPRRLEARWLPPIPVAMKDEEENSKAVQES